ncbi:enoyl-CoA hydratase-related protein [Sphingorhabdus sp.]|jgi:2-(1,2-epoxy-1,2-dihydrophenyl)acetyl-CoA isomerase|uniref:enoyl-CoA hydratase-related protein n=1 Tax=Sphingorhabdus sp. TaxID=1902408 RepID=UPI0037C73179
MSKNTERASLKIDGSVATISLLRANQLNAFDLPMHNALTQCLDEIEINENIRVIILTAEGRAFSTGQDLFERAKAFEVGEAPDIRGSLDVLYNPLIRRIIKLPIPVISAVNGIALGAGAAIAIACDITLAAVSARFQFSFVNVGLGPDSGASWVLPRLIGTQRAMDLSLSARLVSGREAEAMGLVARCVEDEDLLPQALNLAQEISGKSADAVSSIKRLIRETMTMSFDEALDAERDNQTKLGQTIAYREAVLRFSERSRL